MSLNTWSSVELTKCEWSSYWKSSTGQPEMSFTDDESVISYFTEGQCGALAYEIHILTGWTIALLSDGPVGSPNYMGHLFVIDSDAYAIDIKGRRQLADVQDEWYFCSYLHRFWDLKEFEYEMLEWEMLPRFDRDREAKYWAQEIVDMLK